jgi:multidrug efflux pump subunit AcrA (membrane-fusion protein)
MSGIGWPSSQVVSRRAPGLRSGTRPRILAAARTAFVLAVLACAFFPSRPRAHEGHDHGAAQPVQAVEGPRFSAQSRRFEIVAFPLGSDLVIYLDRADDNDPVAEARITVDLDGTPVLAEESAPGIYVASDDRLLVSGTRRLAFTVGSGEDQERFAGTLEIASPARTDVPREGSREWARGGALAGLGFAIAVVAFGTGRLRLGGALLVVIMAIVLMATTARGQEGQAISAPETAPHRHPDGSVFLPKPTQRVLGIRTVRAAREEVAPSVEIAGRVIADPNGMGRVQAIRDGRIEPGPNGFPHLGQAVAKDQVLGYLIPTLTASEESTLRQTLAQIERDIALLVPRSDALGVVNPNMPMSEASASLLQELQIQAEGLNRQKEAVLAALRQRIEIKSPIAGLISAVNVTAGEVKAARDTLFEIVDRGAVLVQGWSFDPAIADDVAGGTALTEDGRELKLAFLGRGPVLQQLAVPLLFRLVDPPALDVGAPVRIFLRATRKIDGVLLPSDAVTRGGNGRSVVWEHTTPETFVPRTVRVTPVDARRVLVSGEVEPDMRLVTAGAGLISQVR